MRLLKYILGPLYHQCSKGIFMKESQEKVGGPSQELEMQLIQREKQQMILILMNHFKNCIRKMQELYLEQH